MWNRRVNGHRAVASTVAESEDGRTDGRTGGREGGRAGGRQEEASRHQRGENFSVEVRFI